MNRLNAVCNTIRKAISDAAVANGWTATLIYDNDASAVPADTAIWARVTVRPGERTRSSVGAGLFRRTGLLIVQIFAPSGSGDGGALAFADQVAAEVDEATIGSGTPSSPTIRFRAVSTRTLGADGMGWWQINVSAPWYTDQE